MDNMVRLIFLLSFYLLHLYAQQLNFDHGCQVKIEPVGCYIDKYSDRALKHQVLNGKDDTSEVYWGKLVDWGNYQGFLKEFLCSCAEKSYDMGYRIIGLQHFAECWSADFGEADYDRHGRVNYCINGDEKPCADHDMTCMGKDQANFIYRIAPTSCETYYQPIGCMMDSGIEPRPLPHFATTEKDYKKPNWNGLLIDWKHWNQYSPLMVCRCAEAAKRIRHRFFGLQAYGECWTARDNSTLARDGHGTRCVAQNFDHPNVNSYIAVGKDHNNFIYELQTGPGKVKNETEGEEKIPIYQDILDDQAY